MDKGQLKFLSGTESDASSGDNLEASGRYVFIIYLNNIDVHSEPYKESNSTLFLLLLQTDIRTENSVLAHRHINSVVLNLHIQTELQGLTKHVNGL